MKNLFLATLLCFISVFSFGQAVSNPTSTAGTITGMSQGQNIIGSATGGITSVASELDVTILEAAGVGDACARISAAEAAGTLGVLLNARGFTGTQACALSPFPSSALSDLLLGPTVYQAHQTWCAPGKINISGEGWDATAPTGVGASTIQATSDLINGGAHPGPIFAWGAPARNCWGTGVVTAPAVQNSVVTGVTIDCANLQTTGVQDFNCNEDCGMEHFKIINCLQAHQLSLELGGPINLSGNTCTVTNASSTITCTRIDPSMINAPLLLAGATNQCVTGNQCIIASTTNGTTGTLAQQYTGTTCTNCVVTVANANSQNGYFMHGNMGGATCPAAGSGADAIVGGQTGSGANMGVRLVSDMTIISGCGANISPLWAFSYSGAGMVVEAIHIETGVGSGGTPNGFCFGCDSVSDTLSVNGLTGSNMNTSGDLLRFSNAFASTNLSGFNVKAVANSFPTNTINDQIGGNTITTAAEKSVAIYAMAAANRVFTTASNINTGLAGPVSSAGTACAGGNFGASGWGTGATPGSISGTSQKCKMSITSGASSFAASPTITFTFPVPFKVAPLCTADVVAITGAGGSIIFNQTTVSATAPVFTAATNTGGTFTPAASETYTILISCGP